jgi:predicted AAA+ superfamily ATPase
MFKRKLVSQLVKRLNEPRRFIQIVTGPRQTGKTTAVSQALEELRMDEDNRFHVPLKAVLTGSSSLLPQKGLAESLMGRFEILCSAHWNYAECKEAFGYSLAA